MQECWKLSDNPKAFGQALQDRGFYLARGDKRGFVVLDHGGEVYSLPKMLGLKTKEVRQRLGDGAALPDVASTQKTIGEKMTPAIRRHVEESRTRFLKRSATLGHFKMEMTQLHREARRKLDQKQAAEWLVETKERSARLPKGLRGLWHRITGEYQKVRAFNEDEVTRTRDRHAGERQALIDKQLDQRRVLQTQFRELRRGQAQQILSLRHDLGRFLALSRGLHAPPKPARRPSMALKLER